jgi:hypothetical protein
MKFNEKELAFLRILCSSKHKHVSQEVICEKLVEAEIIKVDEFKALKRKLLFSGVIGIVYGNITIEDEAILHQILDS